MTGTTGADRPIDRYRKVVARYTVEATQPIDRLPNRDALIDKLTEEIRPFLDVMVEADAARKLVARYDRMMRDRVDSRLSLLIKLERTRARKERRDALRRLRQMARNEETVLRYLLLRELVRTSPAEGAAPVEHSAASA